ncbi:hypothetical protein Ahy_A08g039469 [Arachis hypogaea]|uniref:Transposase MuDR plant domain-containing protein n=1 Tax=Arachis hypogaea TaxID=3818 RepID=A0A445BWU8_ARAHY|nr:hypothetical protein Ahy_A08g039469 [Arachis hypogaea]
MLGDDNMRVIFHIQSRFSNLGAIELFIRMVDVEGSSSGSVPNPSTAVIEGSSSTVPAGQPMTPFVSSSSFTADFPIPTDDLGDGRNFGELAVAMGAAPVVDGAPIFMERERDPFAEAIGDDGSDSEPPIIGDESNGEEDTTHAGGAQTHASSQTQQYPQLFSTLDLDALNQLAFPDQQHLTIHVDRPSMIGTDVFEIEKWFESKKKVVMTVKKYKVFDSDQLKYHKKCVQFENGPHTCLATEMSTDRKQLYLLSPSRSATYGSHRK